MDNNQKDLNKSPARTTSTPKSPPNIKLERELKRKEMLNSRIFNLHPVKLFEGEATDNSNQANNLPETNGPFIILKPN